MGIKWVFLVLGIVAAICAHIGNSRRNMKMALLGAVGALVCVVVFFIFHFGAFEPKNKDVTEREGSPLGVGVLEILRKNQVDPMQEMFCIIENEDDTIKAMEQALKQGGYNDIDFIVMDKEEWDSFDDFVEEKLSYNIPGKIIMICGRLNTADAFEDLNNEIFYIGNPPPDLKNTIAVVRAIGVENAISQNPKKDFAKNYSVEEK